MFVKLRLSLMVSYINVDKADAITFYNERVCFFYGEKQLDYPINSIVNLSELYEYLSAGKRSTND